MCQAIPRLAETTIGDGALLNIIIAVIGVAHRGAAAAAAAAAHSTAVANGRGCKGGVPFVIVALARVPVIR